MSDTIQDMSNENLVHPIDPNKRLDTRAKEPGKNLERQKKSVLIRAEMLGTISETEIMKRAGYSVSYAETQQSDHKRTKSFKALLEELMPDESILRSHMGLMNSRRLDHMTFPLKIEDDEIQELLASVNCILRKVVHSEQAKHAYFWSPDNRARKDAIDMLYKLKGSYSPEKFEDVSKFKDMTDEELIKRRQAAMKLLKKR